MALHGDKGKILVVDDDIDMQRLLNRCLRSAGYEVVVAADGAGSISAARKQAPDLMVLDIGLPAGDGFKVLERMQRNVELSTIPVVVYTASPTAEKQARETGAAGFVSKTAGSEDLLGTIQSLIG